MKSLIRPGESRVLRPERLAAWALAVAAVTATAGIAASQGAAAPTRNADTTSHLRSAANLKHPKLRHGVLTIEGSDASDAIVLRLRAGDPGVLEVDVGADGSADFSFTRKRIASIAVDARAGDDLVSIDESNGAFTDSIPATIDGGDGNDTLLGGSGAETLRGGAGNDLIDGNKGNDLALMGSGDDVFVWNPGDGSDVVEGQDGADTMRFNGANAAEKIELSANGTRLKLSRDVGNVTMDTAGVERVDVNALGGADLVTVNELSGTGVGSVNVDLAGTLGGGAGDGQIDRVVVNGTNGDNSIDVSGDASEVKVSGLVPTVAIFHSEVANDRLEVNTLAGRDTIDTPGLVAGAIQLVVDGVPIP